MSHVIGHRGGSSVCDKSHVQLFLNTIFDRRRMSKSLITNPVLTLQSCAFALCEEFVIELVRIERTTQPEIAKHVELNSSVVFIGNGASYVNRSDQHQRNNDDDERNNNDVSVLNDGSYGAFGPGSGSGDGFGGVGNGGNHGLGVDGECMSDRGF